MFEFDVPRVESIRCGRRASPRRFVLVAVPEGDPFDLIGPLSVLREANGFLAESGRSDLAYRFEIVASEPGTIFEVDGLTLVAKNSCYDVRGPVDTVVFQAVDYEGRCLRDARFLGWVRRIAKRARRVATACIGTYVLAEAGVLDGRRATTHWCATADFRRRYPRVELDPDPIFVKDENIYTSAGITSILDLMIALVEEDFGSELALRVAQGMVMFLRRPGHQSQFSVPLIASSADDDRVRVALSHVFENLGGDLRAEKLAEVAGMSPRSFFRAFSRETGMTPGKFVETARLESARRQLEQSRMPIQQIARENGYGTGETMRLAFDRHLGVTPRDYRRRFSSASAASGS